MSPDPDQPAPPTPPSSPQSSWTLGPAKTGAAGFLGGAAIIATVWALTTRGTPPPTVQRRAPAPAQQLAPGEPQPFAPTRVVPDITDPEATPIGSPVGSPVGSPIGTPLDTRAPSTRATPADTPTNPASPINLQVAINHAPQQEIQLLPGVGPVLAARIVEYRDEHGRFRSIYDLQRVRGIGPKTAEQIAPHVTFE